jgi:hypothetical protein
MKGRVPTTCGPARIGFTFTRHAQSVKRRRAGSIEMNVAAPRFSLRAVPPGTWESRGPGMSGDDGITRAALAKNQGRNRGGVVSASVPPCPGWGLASSALWPGRVAKSKGASRFRTRPGVRRGCAAFNSRDHSPALVARGRRDVAVPERVCWFLAREVWRRDVSSPEVIEGLDGGWDVSSQKVLGCEGGHGDETSPPQQGLLIQGAAVAKSRPSWGEGRRQFAWLCS